jgi:hypothetical protein
MATLDAGEPPANRLVMDHFELVHGLRLWRLQLHIVLRYTAFMDAKREEMKRNPGSLKRALEDDTTGQDSKRIKLDGQDLVSNQILKDTTFTDRVTTGQVRARLRCRAAVKRVPNLAVVIQKAVADMITAVLLEKVDEESAPASQSAEADGDADAGASTTKERKSTTPGRKVVSFRKAKWATISEDATRVAEASRLQCSEADFL